MRQLGCMIRCPHCHDVTRPLRLFVAAVSEPAYVCPSCGARSLLAQRRLSLLSGVNGALMAFVTGWILRFGWGEWPAGFSTVALGCISMMTLLLCFGSFEPPDEDGPGRET